MDMDINMNMDINSNASDPPEYSSFYPSCSTNVKSNGSGSNAGVDSEDSLIDNPRRPPAPRQKINARERYRTFNVNAAYDALRGLIPTEPVNRKLSKIEIIRLASSYITHLHSTLLSDTDQQPCLLQKWEHKFGNYSTGAAQRVNICTFCKRPPFSRTTENRQ